MSRVRVPPRALIHKECFLHDPLLFAVVHFNHYLPEPALSEGNQQLAMNGDKLLTPFSSPLSTRFAAICHKLTSLTVRGELHGCCLGYTIAMYIKEGRCEYRNGVIVWRCGYPRLWLRRSISKKATRSRFELLVSGCSK